MSFDQSTKKSLFGYKLWARIAIGTGIVADFFAFLYLVLLTKSMEYAIIPLLLLLVGGVFLGLSFIIDYRYAYSIWFAVGYSLLQTIGVISLIFYTGVNVDVTMSTFAYLVYVITHLFAVGCYNLAAYTTNKLNKSSAKAGGVIVAVAFLAAAFSIFYTVTFGFFGQNIGLFDNEMVLVYEKNEDNTYVVKDVLYGRGDTVVIPEAFDGKSVTSVSAEILTKRAIKKIVIQNEKGLEIKDLEVLSQHQEGAPQIQVPIELIDYYREILFDASIELNSKSAMALCNEVTYVSCPENKSVVSFNYDFDNLPKMAQKKLLPTIILDKGSTFKLEDYVSDISYLAFVDADTEEEMKESYYQGEGYYLHSPTVEEGRYLDGMTVNSSIEVLPLSFGRVFLIDVTKGNDEKYQVPKELSAIVNGTDYGKLVRDNQLSTYVASVSDLVKREGFDVKYKVDGKDLSAETLLESLKDKNNTVIVSSWTIHAPKIIGIDGNKTYTYGDELLSLSVNAESVHNIKYQLVDSDSLVANENTFTKSRPTPADSGIYTFKVYIDDEKTSLTAEATAEASITVSKKKVEASWTLPENAVYNENAHMVSATISSDKMVFEDSSTVVTSIFDNTGEKVLSLLNAGIYRAQVTFADEDLDRLYTIINATKEIEVARCRVDAIWTNTSLVYTGKQNAPSVAVNGVSHGLECKVISDSVNAGDYTAYVEFVNDVDKRNYSINNISQDYTISAKVINAFWSNSTLQYSDTDQAPKITGFESNSLCEGDTLDLEQIRYNGLQKNAGSDYTVIASEDFLNYDISGTTSSCSFQITKAPLLISVENKEAVYDGKIFDEVFDVNYEGLLGNDTPTSVIAQLYYGDDVANAQNADTYQIVLSANTQGVDYGNYEITYTQGKSLTINKAKAKVEWGSGRLTYTSLEQHPSVTVTGVSQGSLEIVVTGAKINAGEDYVAEIALKNALDIQNYYIDSADSSLDFVINPKALTVTAENKSKVYDGKVYTGFTYTYQGLGASDTLEQVISKIEFGAEATQATNAGEYSIQMTATSGEKRANYDLRLVNGKLVISQATASVTFGNNSFVFDTVKKLPTVTVTGVALDGGARESVSFNAYAKQNNQRVEAINVGSYTTEIELTNSNYVLDSYNGSFEITPATASVVWGETSLTYSGVAQLPGVSVKGVNDLPVDFTLSTSNGAEAINVGDYVAKITLNDSNYVLTSYTKDFAIKPFTADIAWLGAEKVYSGDSQLPTAVVKGVNGTVIYSYTISTTNGAEAIDVGEYEAKITLNNNNYVLDSYTKKFTITQKEISPSFKNVTLTYNGKAQLPSFIFMGVKGEAIEYSVVANDGQSPIDVGDYVAAVALKNDNYKLLSNEVEFKIEQATASAVWGNTTLTYTGEAQLPSVTVTGVGNTQVDFTLSTENGTEAINVGDYVAKITLNDNNYKLESYTMGFKIAPMQVNVSWTDKGPYTYNGRAQKPSVTVTGVGGVNVEISVAYTELDKETVTDSVNAGTYVSIITLNNANYTIDNGDEELTYVINKRDLTITARDLTVDYTGNSFDESLTYDQEGLAETDLLSDIVEINLTGDAIGATEAGTYTIEPSKTVINDQNYNVILVNGTLTINQVVSAPDQE